MLVQVLITRQGYAMNPIQSLYYVTRVPRSGPLVELPEILPTSTWRSTTGCSSRTR